MGDFGSGIYIASVWILPLVLAITLHEAAHGYVALRFGDDTALMAGRVTLNPLKHVDLWGTIIIPGLLIFARAPFLFGYAKPVPVDFGRLGNPRRDMIWVAGAGPAMNLFLAVISALLIHGVGLLPAPALGWVADNLINSLRINVLLAVFNLLPLPPLDGGRIAVGLLPDSLARPLSRVEPFGIFILIGALFLLPYLGGMLGVELNIFRWLVGVPSHFLLELIATLTGHG
ncbi:MAG: site-2 protease family protein [Alphaproteobacteria bacterium]|nr:site-2 protease family protein [Alphaproteobacteria bacterium]MCZ6740996.1 site-2 protease family protein [Alphaproteobacteria bacterium]MCZ6849466.1 site-2 protease family protein [Alphaproteobacteria bacterium]